MIALVEPIGDFPLNDDFVYALGVKSVLQTGRFELPSAIPSAANVMAQVYWGALFCLPGGFSFTALRFSTLTLGGAGVLLLYCLTREIGGTRWTALLGSLTLAVNPLYFGLANTFMTDVPFLVLMIAALWLFVRGVKREETGSFVAAIVVALLAVFVRQFALLLLLGFGISYIARRGATWRSFVIAIAPLLLGIGLHLGYQQWMIETARTKQLDLATLSELIPTGLGRFIHYSAPRAVRMLPFVGFMIAPLLVAVLSFRTGLMPELLAGVRPRRQVLFGFKAFALVSGLLMVLASMHPMFPARLGNVLAPSGLGPDTLSDALILRQNSAEVPAAMSVFWGTIATVGAFGAIGAVLYTLQAVLQIAKGFRGIKERPTTWLRVLIISVIGFYAAILLLLESIRGVVDRYLLMFIPLVLMLVVIEEGGGAPLRMRKSRLVLSVALLVLYTGFSSAAAHDYLAWHRTRWVAIASLTDTGVSSYQIDGGLEFNAWFDPNYPGIWDKDVWQASKFEYIVTSTRVDGYREVRRFRVNRWLPSTDAPILVLRRALEAQQAPAFGPDTLRPYRHVSPEIVR